MIKRELRKQKSKEVIELLKNEFSSFDFQKGTTNTFRSTSFYSNAGSYFTFKIGNFDGVLFLINLEVSLLGSANLEKLINEGIKGYLNK